MNAQEKLKDTILSYLELSLKSKGSEANLFGLNSFDKIEIAGQVDKNSDLSDFADSVIAHLSSKLPQSIVWPFQFRHERIDEAIQVRLFFYYISIDRAGAMLID